MNFDPAIAAQAALARARANGELADDLAAVVDAEERFSSSAGADAAEAYQELTEIGERHIDAEAYQAFLIHITWQQVTEQTIPRYFQHGHALSRRYLDRFADVDHDERRRVEALHQSFRAGLGLADETEDEEYERDTFKGGD